MNERKWCAVLCACAALSLSCDTGAGEDPAGTGRGQRDGLQIQDVVQNARRVPRYGLFELTFNVAGSTGNPFDPDDIAVDAVITSPSRKTFTVPAFWFQDYEMERADPRRKWHDVSVIKTYIAENTWPAGKPVVFYVDDLRVERDGKTERLCDFESLEGIHAHQQLQVSLDDVRFTEGKHALKVVIDVDKEENWPGFSINLQGQDWRNADRVSFQCYLEVDDMKGELGFEFYTRDGTKVQRSFGTQEGLVPNQWCTLVWDFNRLSLHEEFIPKGKPCWKVRYTPVERGRHTCKLTARCGKKTAESAPRRFVCTRSRDHGFIRIAPNRQYLGFDDGTPYFAIGENCCWPTSHGGISDDERWFSKLGAARANFVRVWNCSFTATAIEGHARGTKDGPCHYRLDNAWKLDRVLDIARRNGLRVMFCIETFGPLVEGRGWEQFPYYVERGGPCEKAHDFFTNEDAKEFFRKRLRYTVARWGWDTYVMTWEFFNEINIVDGFDDTDVPQWHKEMARYLRSIDPYKRPIHTSFGGPQGTEAIHTLPEMEIVQTHSYGAPNYSAFINHWTRWQIETYGKPYWFGEFGLNTKNTNDFHSVTDPDGVYVHNGAWASLASGAAGTAMTWYWDVYVDKQDLYHIYTPVAKFVEGIPFNSQKWTNVTVTECVFTDGGTRFGEFVIDAARGSWGPAEFNKAVEVVLSPDGTLDRPELVSGVLHGTGNHADLHNPVTFVVEYDSAGGFGVNVSGVSGYGGADLTILLDGRPVLSKDFPDDLPDDTKTITKYDRMYAVSVPQGKHRIQVVNNGKDWIRVPYYRFYGGVKMSGPALDVYGQACEKMAFLWFHNQLHNWSRLRDKLELYTQPKAAITLKGFADGVYSLTWFDTRTGRERRGGRVVARGGVVRIETPEIEKDVAAKLLRR